MAATATVMGRGVPGSKYEEDVDILLDNNYPTGGYPITPAMVGLNRITGFRPTVWSTAPGAVAADFVHVRPANGNPDMLKIIGANGAEIPAGTNLSGLTIQGIVHGT